MFNRLNLGKSCVLASMALSTLAVHGFAQGTRPCRTGNCGTPLAGPCVPERATYAYVPTSWRRWPTDVPANKKAPEELPTPAPPATESLPEPGTRPTRPESRLDGPSGDSLTPPFESSPTPSFSDEPPRFEDEPQAPPSSADSLSAPFDDEPPSLPSDEGAPTSTPMNTPQAPIDPAPSRGAEPPAAESDAPPSMPIDDLFKDDPFKDDPEPKSGRTSEAGSATELYSLGRTRNAAASRDRETSRTRETASVQYQTDVPPTTADSQPRLLQANGESLPPSRLHEPVVEEANPLRAIPQHDVRRTSFAAERELESVPSKPAVWRHNPLRGK